MVRFLKPFFIFIVLYHLFVTIVEYGIFWWTYPQAPALGRDAIWLLFFAIIAISNFKTIQTYLGHWKRPRITFIILLLFWTSMSLLKGKWIFDIFIGIKYGLFYIFIFLSATYIGRTWSKKNINKFLKFLKYLLITTLLVGFLRQWIKFIWPEIFLKIGYGPLNDFTFWEKPPIYYLTGYQGTSRRQWLFSWPNNYGYFLIAFLPAIFYFLKQKFVHIKKFTLNNKKTIINTAIIGLRLLAILLTLSRTAFIGGMVALAVMNVQRIRKHKKIAIGIWIALLAGLIWLSIVKWASTIWHIKAKFGSIKYVIDKPSWYGLGTSGPAVHHNGTILPENYYIQLMLDIGTIGFIIRAMLIWQITRIGKKIQENIQKTQQTQDDEIIYLIRKWLTIWRVCLLIMWLFLHSFEDSMINYLFFISRGILSGYLSKSIKKLPTTNR